MSNTRLSALVLAALAAACSATTGLAQWNSVAYVDAQGRQWRQLDLTCGLSWNQVAAICPTDGVTRCTGTINNQSVSGWIWATRAQVQQLLAEMGAQTSDCSSGSAATGSVFSYFNSTTNFDLLSVAHGWTATLSVAPGTKGFAIAPYIRFDQDIAVGFTCVNTPVPRDQPQIDRGVWLFRPPCPADINRDGTVGPADLSVLLGSWGTGGAADLSGNGTVGAEDLSVMLASWGSGNC